MRHILSLVLLFSSILSFSQKNWIEKPIGNEIVVKFPINTTYKLNGKVGTYTAKTENNILMVVVQYDVIPRYSDFVQLPQEQQVKLIDVFLDNAIKGMLKQAGREGHTYTSIQVGNFKGRESSYNGVNPISGDLTMKYTKMVYANNKMYVFQCMYLGTKSECKSEKDIFMNSISIN